MTVETVEKPSSSTFSAISTDCGDRRGEGSITRGGGESSAPPPQLYTIGKHDCGGTICDVVVDGIRGA